MKEEIQMEDIETRLEQNLKEERRIIIEGEETYKNFTSAANYGKLETIASAATYNEKPVSVIKRNKESAGVIECINI